MLAAGLDPDSFDWVVLPQKQTSSTRLILEQVYASEKSGERLSSGHPTRDLYDAFDVLLFAERLLEVLSQTSR